MAKCLPIGWRSFLSDVAFCTIPSSALAPAQPDSSYTLWEAGYTLGCQVSTLVLLSGLLLLPHPLLPYGGFEGSPGGFLH